jgi:hypothetical protein
LKYRLETHMILTYLGESNVFYDLLASILI